MFRSPIRYATGAISAVLLVVAALTPASTDEPVPRWQWPVDPPRSLVRPFLAPATPYSAGHRGVDIRAPAGFVYAPADGEIHFSGMVAGRPVLSIEHAGGLISSYEPVTSTLSAGQAVRRGELVGIAEAGHCAALCLHFGVRLEGLYISPMNLLGGIPRSVLLPTRPLTSG